MDEVKRLDAAGLLALDPVGEGVFRAVHNLDNGRRAIFGGQPMAQGLAAAACTVAGGWPIHTMSAHYLRAGSPATPIDYRVEATRDGRRFASRRVLAMQDGKPIFDMLCAFHDEEEGPVHDATGPHDLPGPDGLPTLAEVTRAHADRLPARMVEVYGAPFPVEMRLIGDPAQFTQTSAQPRRDFWFRMKDGAGVDDPMGQQCLLAFMSDFWFSGTAGAMHFTPVDAHRIAMVTLNHSMWFHAPVRTDDWLLFRTESPWAAKGRGLVRGFIHNSGGQLLASAAQEVSIRVGP